MSAILEVGDLTSGYVRNVPIVHSFSETFSEGEVTTLVGPNGAGKSTVLKSLYGMLKYSSGSILLNGEEIIGLKPRERLALGMGFGPQGRSNFQQMTVGENMIMAGFSLPKSEMHERVERVRRSTPIVDERWKTPCGSLSGGQQQIVEMAMVMLMEPRVLLVDEPSLGLSPKMQKEVHGQIRKIADDGVCVIMVEQNVKGGLAISDRAVVLDQGVQVFSGTADEVLNDPRMSDIYLGGGFQQDDDDRPDG